uniref:Tyrosine-protein phosphatase domain-containing protein n=1 Tax=Romanomermis culicivorax TaxID=13658 RepID=A0A915L2Q7_ROMCU
MDRDSPSRGEQVMEGGRYARALHDIQSQRFRSSAYKRLKWKFRSKSGGVRFEEDVEKDLKCKKHFNHIESNSNVDASNSSFRTSNHGHFQYPCLLKANSETADPPCASSFGDIVRQSIMIPAITVDCGLTANTGPSGHLSSSLSNSSLNLSHSDDKLAEKGPSGHSKKSFSRRFSRGYLLQRNSRSEQFLDWLTDSMENLVFGNRRNAMVEEQLTSFTGLKDRIRKIIVEALTRVLQPVNILKNPNQFKSPIMGIFTVQQEKAMACVPAFPIETSRFPVYVQERRKKPVLYKGELLILIQNSMIKKSAENHRMDYSKMKEFEIKNHYPEVLPFDYNRVLLSIQDNDPFSHYINASYVD